jgi:hypothetical protein
MPVANSPVINEITKPAIHSASGSSRGLPRAIHDLDLVPNINGGILASGEQLVCAGSGFRVGVAVEHIGCLDPIS